MTTIVSLILNQILNFLAENAEKIIQAIRDEFVSMKGDPDFESAVQDLGYEPTEEKLSKVHDVLKEKGEDPERLAKVLVNESEATA